MGHMDDDNIPTYTVTVRFRAGENTQETFNRCTEVETNQDQLQFVDHSGKTHEFYNVSYHVQQD